VLVNFLGVETEKYLVADVLEEKSLAAVAHHDPVARFDLDLQQ